jgi:membrane-associated protease RseP (regulator of RpoE activity)
MASEGNQAPRVVVNYVHPGFPAAQGGLRAGARILAVNGVATTGMDSIQVMQLLRKAAGARIQPLTLSVEDAGRVAEVNFDGVWACRFSVHVVESDQINAYADGTRILLTTGILHFVAGDDELAFVLAHEIAHNALEHSQTTRLKSALDNFLAATTGEMNPGMSPPARRSLEAQADYVGMQIVAKAGFDVQAAGNFWRRLIKASGIRTSTPFLSTHPDTPDRLMAFERALREIEAKVSRGQVIPGRLAPPGITPSPTLSPN